MPLPSNGTGSTTITTTAAMTTSTSAPTVLVLLDPSNANGTAVFNEDGTVSFVSDAYLRLSEHGMAVSSSFSIALDFVQAPGTSGYYFAKSDMLGRRYYSLYNTATTQQVYFVYRIPGSTTTRFARFTALLNDGERHRVSASPLPTAPECLCRCVSCVVMCLCVCLFLCLSPSPSLFCVCVSRQAEQIAD